MCTACWIPNSFYHHHHLVLRGLCSRSKFDQILDVLNDDQGYVSYKGRTNTLITYDPVERIWTMRIVNDPDTFAVSRASLESLLMGGDCLADVEMRRL